MFIKFITRKRSVEEIALTQYHGKQYEVSSQISINEIYLLIKKKHYHYSRSWKFIVQFVVYSHLILKSRKNTNTTAKALKVYKICLYVSYIDWSRFALRLQMRIFIFHFRFCYRCKHYFQIVSGANQRSTWDHLMSGLLFC
jgi:hypothetical protein